jgi:hypothetical protein
MHAGVKETYYVGTSISKGKMYCTDSEMQIIHTDPYKTFVVAALCNALFTSFNKLLYPSIKKEFFACCQSQNCEVWTVRGIIYQLKFQFLDGGKCCSSSVWSRIVMQKKDTSGQKYTTVNCRLHFLFQHGAVPYTVDCLSFLLIVFENSSIHIPEQCQYKFSGRRCQLEFFLAGQDVSPFHGLSFGLWFIIMIPGFIPRDNAYKKLSTLSMVTCQESSATQHALQIVFIGQLSQYPPGTQ